MIFEEQISRKPDLYPWTKRYIDVMWAGHWTPNHFDFQSDLHQFKVELAPQEQQIIVRALSAISQVEVSVKRFWAELGNALPHPSIRDLGYEMAHIEVIHNYAYEKLLTVLGLDDVYKANLQEEVIAGRVNYLHKHLNKVYTEDNRKQFIYSLILFTLFVENVSLFSQFYIVSWFNRYRNMLKDTAQQIQYTAKEENIHARIGIQLVNVIRAEHPELFDDELAARIHEESMSAFEAECNLIDWILGNYIEDGLSGDVLKNYVADRINRSLRDCGFPECATLNVNRNQLEASAWMDEELLAPAITDFFHKKPIEYAKASHTFSEDDVF